MQPLRQSVPFDYAAIQDGLLTFLCGAHGYRHAIADYSLQKGFGAATDGTALAICGEFRRGWPAYALFSTAHHAGHGQQIRAQDHARILALLELSHENLPADEKQNIIREIYAQDYEVSCMGMGLLMDAFDAGDVPLSTMQFQSLLDEMHDYYLHDVSEFLRCLETGTLPRLTHTPQQTPRHSLVQDLIYQSRQAVLPAIKLPTALVFHVGTSDSAAISPAADRDMRAEASRILDELGQETLAHIHQIS